VVKPCVPATINNELSCIFQFLAQLQVLNLLQEEDITWESYRMGPPAAKILYYHR
jgi:hypothetical protein